MLLVFIACGKLYLKTLSLSLSLFFNSSVLFHFSLSTHTNVSWLYCCCCRRHRFFFVSSLQIKIYQTMEVRILNVFHIRSTCRSRQGTYVFWTCQWDLPPFPIMFAHFFLLSLSLSLCRRCVCVCMHDVRLVVNANSNFSHKARFNPFFFHISRQVDR